MKHIFSVALAVVVGWLLSACQTAPVSMLSAKATGESSVFSVGTLCSAGSFECEVAPSYARIASIVHTATFDFRQGRITAAQLQTIVDRGRLAITALDEVMATCKQSPQTGRCTGNEHNARSLLAVANRTVESLR